MTDSTVTRGGTATKTSVPPTLTMRPPAAIAVPGLPDVRPYAFLREVWRPAHTRALLEALGDVDPLVTRTARSIGGQQVGFDGLISLGGAGVLEVAVSPRSMAQSLHLYNVLLAVVRQWGGEVTAKDQTVIRLRGESIRIRLRESADRHEDTTKAYPSNTYVPTGRLSFAAVTDLGGNCKTPVADTRDVEGFVEKVSRLIDRFPRIRAEREERQRIEDEKWARFHETQRLEAEERRQWKEQQERFNQITEDIEQWGKAERVRAYVAAAEARLSENGPIGVGGKVDGWLRWLHWYADRLDPMTRPEGAKQGPE